MLGVCAVMRSTSAAASPCDARAHVTFHLYGRLVNNLIQLVNMLILSDSFRLTLVMPPQLQPLFFDHFNLSAVQARYCVRLPTQIESELTSVSPDVSFYGIATSKPEHRAAAFAALLGAPGAALRATLRMLSRASCAAAVRSAAMLGRCISPTTTRGHPPRCFCARHSRAS